MKKYNFEETSWLTGFFTVVIAGTIMSFTKNILYNQSMNDWIAIIMMSICSMFFARFIRTKKKENIIFTMIFLFIAVLFILKFFNLYRL